MSLDAWFAALDDESRSEEAEPTTGDEVFAGPLSRVQARLYEMVFQRLVDQYLTYLAHILALLFRTRPETLHAPLDEGRRADSGIALETILQHETMEELLDTIVDRRVQDLSYRGMADVAKFLRRRLGFDLFESHKDLETAVLMVELRNLLAHNRGVVNETFLSRVGSRSPWKLGARVVLDRDTHENFIGFMERTAADIDHRAIAKWGLPTIRVQVVEHGFDEILDEQDENDGG